MRGPGPSGRLEALERGGAHHRRGGGSATGAGDFDGGGFGMKLKGAGQSSGLIGSGFNGVILSLRCFLFPCAMRICERRSARRR